MNNYPPTQDFAQKRDIFETWVHRWGNPYSEILVDKPCAYFTLPHIEGFIGYYLRSGCAVTFGNPVCAPKNAEELADSFCKFAKGNQWNAIFIFASEQFSKWAIKNICHVLIDVGEELVFNPQLDPLKLKKGNNLRNQYNHASAKGLTVKEYASKNEQLERILENIGREWICARKGHQIYLAKLDLFKHRIGKRWFYLSDEDKVVGVALLSKRELYEGWFLKHLFVLQNSPKGSSEFLMVSMLEQLKQENCKYLTYGSVPAKQIGNIIGLNKISSYFIRLIYALTNRFFHLNHKKLYWQKFHPIEEPTYLLASSSLGLKELYAIKQVLNIEV